MSTEITNIAGTKQISDRRRGWIAALTCMVASVWMFHGLFNKLMGASPRHLLIVQAVPGLGGNVGRFALVGVGIVEVAIAVWILSGRRARVSAAVQTVVLLSMNVVELTWARKYLLWPAGLVPVNLCFLGLAWANALLREPTLSVRITNPLYRLRRHPIPVTAFFEHSLVVTYAFPRRVLEPLLPPGLELDAVGDVGFVAVAMVQTRGLRPAGFPRVCGRDFFLAGYRIFVKFRVPADGTGGSSTRPLRNGTEAHLSARTLRGMFILRRDADRLSMVWGGNLLTHYHYRKCESIVRKDTTELEIAVCTGGGEADVHVVANLDATGVLPAGSPFRTEHEARRFAGPLPFTFDYEPETESIVIIRGVRENWSPALVNVHVRQMNFFNSPSFRTARPVLASAFYVHDIPYRWERGVRVSLRDRKGAAGSAKPQAGLGGCVERKLYATEELLMNASTLQRSRFQGVGQIFRFNWTQYALGSACVLAAAVIVRSVTLPRSVKIVLLVGTAVAGFWLLASLVVSYIVYDRSKLRRWDWLAAAIGATPRTWVNVHSGLDESSAALRAMFPESRGRVFDIFDAAEMTERSISRAREAGGNAAASERVDYRRLPLADSSIDAAFLLLSVHELRQHASRVALLAELRRSLAADGRIVLAEHLRDVPNFIAFGPGFTHFHSRATWLRAITESGLVVEKTFSITPFLGVFILRRSL